MRAEIIAIGDELITGQRLDTNSPWLSRQLAELGVMTSFHTTVGDHLDANLQAFRTAVARSEVVISTGGLGPTADDLTREALACLCEQPLILHEPSLLHIRQLFAARGRTMPERNRVQALFPRGAEPIPNVHGTAPGIYLTYQRENGPSAHVFALPGVPAEMKEMWQAWVRPRLVQLQPESRVIQQRVIKCFGVGESELEAKLPDLIRRGRNPTVGITASHATLSLRVLAEAPSIAECQRQLNDTAQLIYQHLGPLVFGEGEEYELEHAVVELLSQRCESIAVAEAGTDGRVAHWLAQASALAPTVFAGAWIFPAHACLSPTGLDGAQEMGDWARRLAEQVRGHFRSSWGLAIGPWPKTTGKEPHQQIHFALSSATTTIVRSAATTGHPDLLKIRAAKQALDLIRRELYDAGHPVSGNVPS